MDKGRSDPKPKDPKPAGAVGYDPKPFVPLRDSAAQPLVKGFLRERGREKRKEIKGSKVEKEGRKEGRKEGKGFLWFLVFDLERLCEEGMSISRRLGLPREGKEKEKVFEFWLFWPVFEEEFWFLVFDQ
jgi:hypothetical protein